MVNLIVIQTPLALNLSVFINLGCCLAVVILPIFIFLILVHISKKKKKASSSSEEVVDYASKQEKEIDISDIKEADDHRSHNLDTEGFGKKNRTPLSKIKRLFRKKKVCDDCGTELIYKEDYDSWYCPECHQYK